MQTAQSAAANPRPPAHPSFGPIANIVALTVAEFGVEPREIYEKSMDEPVRRARLAATLLARELTNASLELLASAMRRKDRATMLNRCALAKRLLTDDDDFAERVGEARAAILNAVEAMES